MWDSVIDLPYGMQEKAVWARKQITEYIDDPNIQMCPEGVIWVWNDEHDMWWGTHGKYTSISPEERRLRVLKNEECLAEYNLELEKENAKKIADWEYWSAIRQKVLERDNHTCQNCGTKIKKLHIHHILPRKQNGTDHDDNLITLCAGCHIKIEPRRKKKK